MHVRYPGLHVAVLDATFPTPLGAAATPEALLALLSLDATAPVERSEPVRLAVRDLLRPYGYKPTGRGKPASEYLVAAATTGRLASINPAVDACNAVSLHSGLPVSVVDLDRTAGALHVAAAPAGAAYVFNASGQAIDVGGLPCLTDDLSPCANPVRDSQRTKTHDATRRTRSVVWAPAGADARLAATAAWYRRLLASLGAAVEAVEVQGRDEVTTP